MATKGKKPNESKPESKAAGSGGARTAGKPAPKRAPANNASAKPDAVRKPRRQKEETPRPEQDAPATVAKKHPKSRNVNAEGLTPRQARFVDEYPIDLNGKQAAIRSGYAPDSAEVHASRLLSHDKVKAAIDKRLAERSEKAKITSEQVVERWREQFEGDPGELTQYRRYCCRVCWGKDHVYQYTPHEFERAKLKHAEARANFIAKSKGKVDIGEFKGVEGDWYDRRREPNIDCPECFGDGVGETFIADTRKLSKNGKALYLGVKEGKDGIEVKTVSIEKAGEYLARHLGTFNDSVKVEVTDLSKDALEEKFAKKMLKAHDRMAAVLAERGISDSD